MTQELPFAVIVMLFVVFVKYGIEYNINNLAIKTEDKIKKSSLQERVFFIRKSCNTGLTGELSQCEKLSVLGRFIFHLL